MSLKLGSLFDGSGGFPLAGAMCGIEPVWASEIEPYPIAVTKSRFPNMKHLGDISKINGAEIEPVDIITFGSPCQDMSVAGKRAGLKHEANGDEETTRSGLFMEAVRIIKEMREKTNGEYPRFAIWENVPGAFSSNKGEDFRIVLEELIKVAEPYAVMPEVPKKGWAYADCYSGDGWSLAYRVFDAQYWGVPQRRRRIYLVADFRGQCARQILFECKGLRGYFTQSREAGQTVASDAERSVGADDRAGTVCYGIGGYNSEGMKSANPNSGIYIADTSRTLDLNGGNPACNQGGIAIVESGGFKELNSAKARSDAFEMEKSPTLAANKHDASVAFALAPVASTLRAGAGAPKHEQDFVGRLVLQPVGLDGYNGTVTGDKSATLGVNCGMSTGRNGVVVGYDDYNQTLTGDKTMSVTGAASDIHHVPGVVYSVENHPADWKHAEVANTLNTFDQGEARANELVVYALDRASFNQGQNAQYDFEITDSGVNSTVVAKRPSAVCHAIGNGQVDQTGLHDIPGVLNCMHDQQAVMVAQGMDCRNGKLNGDLCGTLQAKPNGGFSYNCIHPVILRTPVRYIVRRLTPTECARLQGFPDTWGHIEPKAGLTDKEYAFWRKVRDTHETINGRVAKSYNEKQMLAWYNKLHTDSAEYKLWGNGIALPCALYVMQGIADVMRERKST